MQITVQMLDGSITPFKVRSSITVARLKAKFEPWQPMKGRALLHHDVQLDDHATLGSVPGVKDGTILRVDKHVSQVKNKSAGKKTVMSGPASSTVDEEIVESIEMSGGDEEDTSSEDGRRKISNSKRKRPSTRTSAAAIEEDFRHDTNLSSTTMALHLAKSEKRKSTAASEVHELGHSLHFIKNTFASSQEKPVENATATAHVPDITETIPSGDDVMEDDDTAFLAGISAAADVMEEPPLHSETGSEEDVSARRCNACGRACGCGGDPMALSNIVVPVEGNIPGREASPPNANCNGRLIATRNCTSERAEMSWTGM